ncbi:MAG: hypothetical protein HYX68_22805 [Planctomycetes bacterium]|jgi:hypothetical protein|nr:hypothetical protein [Planctomycetota bacterium]
MKRNLILGMALLSGWLVIASTVHAQVFVRAPFVRVAVGNGVAVRAPFVRLFVPGDSPVYAPPYQVYDPLYGPILVPAPRPIIVNQPAPMPPANQFAPPQPLPLPQVKENNGPPPIQGANVPTLQEFSKTFQAKAGSYEVTLFNPATKQPTTVRFTLPEGTPRRVHVTRDSIEFNYGFRRFVRIELDRDGAVVTTR